MAIDIAGFVTDLKEHAIEHGFHVHDERHFVETYSLRQSWEMDVHPEEACNGPIDLHIALDVDPRVLLSLLDRLDEMADDFEEPEGEFTLQLFFNWGVPPLSKPPDLLVLATELPVDVAAIDSFAAVTDAPERSLQMVGKTKVSLVDVLMGREQLCGALDAARDVSLYLVENTEAWM
jgi:hypothetical protein